MRQLIVIMAVVIGIGCTPGVGPLSVTSVQPLTNNCEFPEAEDLNISSIELLDVAADPKATLVATLSGGDFFTGGTAQPPVVVGGRTISPEGRDSITILRVNLRYTAKPPIPGLGASVVDTVPLTGLISSAVPTLRIAFPLFGPTARKQFKALGASNVDPPIQFTPSFQFVGVTTSGAEIRTAPVPIPTNLIKSEITCASADPRIRRFTDANAIDGCFSAGVGRRLANDRSLCCDKLDPMTQTPLVTSTPGCDTLP